MEVAAGVLAEVEMVRAEVTGVAPGVTGDGRNEQVALGGRPAEHVSITKLAKLLTSLTEMM